jgi:cell division protein FtsI/penicillin-binding protein 2
MEKNKRRYGYSRIRGDTGHHRRILAVMVVLGIAAFLPVGLQLYSLMIGQYDYYSQLALRNQTRTTSVTAERGTI